MSDDSLTPEEYEQRRNQYAEQHGWLTTNQNIKQVSSAILSSSKAQDQLREAILEDLKTRVPLTAEPLVHPITSIAFEYDLIIMTASYERIDLENLDYQQIEGKQTRLSPIDPSHGASTLINRTAKGSFRTGMGDEKTLTYYKSWTLEEMGQMGVLIEWDPAEQPDQEPDDQQTEK